MLEDIYPVTPKKLGYLYNPNYCEFRVWAPAQEQVFLAIYENALCVHRVLYSMEKDTDGVFEMTIKSDLEGAYYTFIVGNSEVTDPYAVALSENSHRSVVVDLSQTNPLGWEIHKVPSGNNGCDAIVYELQIADFTGYGRSREKSGYLRLTQSDVQSGGYQRGLSHLKDLGVTHIQIMPINDFLTVDENKSPRSKDNYNWGYDPEHYNVPEGSYASNAVDPKVRIIECKKMIMKLHEEGFQVIIDVVYNHTYRGEVSNFNILVPGYYYRRDKEGKFSNGTGCGNEIATEKEMAKRFIIDSLIYWVGEYKVDGFRFDLMGLIDVNTVKEFMKVLRWMNKDIMVYGEPWVAGDSVLPHEQRTLKGTQVHQGFSLFNDVFRDAVKGGNDDTSKGYIQGNCDRKNAVETGIVGSINFDLFHKGFAANPEESINYINSHDNLILYDKIKKTDSCMDEEARIRMNKLALAILFTAQGIPLIHAGNEFLRSKQMDHNSYKSSLLINEIDWSNKEKYYEFYLYVKDLITLRKTYKGFRMKNAEEIRESIKFVELGNCVIAYSIKQKGEKYDYLLVLHNPLEEVVKIPVEKLFDTVEMKGTMIAVKKVFDEIGLLTTGNNFEQIQEVEVGIQTSAIWEVRSRK